MIRQQYQRCLEEEVHVASVRVVAKVKVETE
jgi:hypothetical protein